MRNRRAFYLTSGLLMFGIAVSHAYVLNDRNGPSAQVPTTSIPANADVSQSAAIAAIQAGRRGMEHAVQRQDALYYMGETSGTSLQNNGKNRSSSAIRPMAARSPETYWWADASRSYSSTPTSCSTTAASTFFPGRPAVRAASTSRTHGDARIRPRAWPGTHGVNTGHHVPDDGLVLDLVAQPGFRRRGRHRKAVSKRRHRHQRGPVRSRSRRRQTIRRRQRKHRDAARARLRTPRTGPSAHGFPGGPAWMASSGAGRVTPRNSPPARTRSQRA